MTCSDLIQVILMGLLVVVTGIYSWRTFAISKATKEQAQATRDQADASLKMLEEMREQRAEAQAIVVPDIDLFYDTVKYYEAMEELVLGDFPVIVTNVGKAAALDIEISLETESHNFGIQRLPILASGGSWRTKFTYVELTEEGEPIFNQVPPNGLYELTASFRSGTSQLRRPLFLGITSEKSDVTLPFDVHIDGPKVKINRRELQLGLLQSMQNKGVNLFGGKK